MRPSACILFLAIGCETTKPPPATMPETITAITYNMYYGIASELVPEQRTAAALSNTVSVILNAVGLTDFRCRIAGAAKQIVAEQPLAIGLQEAILIAYVRDPNDRSEDQVVIDFVDELVGAIESAGGGHFQALVRDNTVIQDTLPFVGGIRFVDRIAILVNPRFPARQAGSLTFHTLQSAGDLVPTGTGEVVRGALHVQVPFTTGMLDFYTTHLQSSGVGPTSTATVREAQAVELVSFVQSSSSPGSIVVLTGDMNDIPGSQTYNTLSAAFVDTYAVAGTPPGYTAYQPQTLDNPDDLATLRLDQIYTNASPSQVAESRVFLNQKVEPCNLWSSDHYGVVSRIRTAATPAPGQ
jgi:endonuclease/exonuclease/phosphatase family metal-dependent hydrolase